MCVREEGGCSPGLSHELHNQQTCKRYADVGKNLHGNSGDRLLCPLPFEKSKEEMKREQAQRAVSAVRCLAVQFPHQGIRDQFHVLT